MVDLELVLTPIAATHRVNNFSKDVSDGENYTVLLSQLKPESCDRAPLQEKDLMQRAELVLQRADAIGCRKYLTPSAMVAGNPKLNLAFVAHLFNTHPCLEPLEEAPPTVIEDFDAEGEREARVFTLWLNSLDVDPGVYNLFEDLKDGTVILQAFDKVVPGSVVWKRVSKPKEGQELSRFKQVENTNYAVDLAKANDMRIVGIQGADIVDGTRTLVLGLVWQLMRLNISKTLSSLGKSGKGVSDVDMVQWANGVVKGAGKSSSMRSFKDPSLKNAVFFLDLLDGLRKGIVDYSLVTQGRNEEECKQNAKLAISIARKLGALIFLVPEDIVDVRQRLILTFVGSLSECARRRVGSTQLADLFSFSSPLQWPCKGMYTTGCNGTTMLVLCRNLLHSCRLEELVHEADCPLETPRDRLRRIFPHDASKLLVLQLLAGKEEQAPR